MSFCIGKGKLLEKCKTIRNKTEGLWNIELNFLPVYDDRYLKTKKRTYGEKVYTYFCSLNMPEGGVELGYFTTISIDSLLAYESKYWANITYKYN